MNSKLEEAIVAFRKQRTEDTARDIRAALLALYSGDSEQGTPDERVVGGEYESAALDAAERAVEGYLTEAVRLVETGHLATASKHLSAARRIVSACAWQRSPKLRAAQAKIDVCAEAIAKKAETRGQKGLNSHKWKYSTTRKSYWGRAQPKPEVNDDATAASEPAKNDDVPADDSVGSDAAE